MKVTEEQLRLLIKSALIQEEKILEFEKRRIGGATLKIDDRTSSSTSDKSIDPETDGSKGSFETSQGGPKISDLDPVAQKPIQSFIDELNKKGYSVILTSAYRSIAKQKSVASSVKAKAGYSPHNFGLAIDLNIRWKNKDGKEQILRMRDSKQEWEKVVGPNGVVPYKNFNLRWGGTFKRYDPVHFDVYPLLDVPGKSGVKADKDPVGFSNALRQKAGDEDKKYSEIIKA
jgi:hypothetical protein